MTQSKQQELINKLAEQMAEIRATIGELNEVSPVERIRKDRPGFNGTRYLQAIAEQTQADAVPVALAKIDQDARQMQRKVLQLLQKVGLK